MFYYGSIMTMVATPTLSRTKLLHQQPLFPFAVDSYVSPLTSAIEELRTAPLDNLGAVYTKQPVAEHILDEIGYVVGNDLTTKQILEPGFGNGAFLRPIVGRLLEDYKKNHGMNPTSAFKRLKDSIRAVEVHSQTYHDTASSMEQLLDSHGFGVVAKGLVDVWLVQGDFLLTDLDQRFDFVAGNPPYVRHDNVSPVLMDEYRRRFKTIYDRADLYVPFFEKSLGLLKKGGRLGFICSDRWMKSRYGKKLRMMVAEDFWLKKYINTNGVDAFDGDVSTYTAITVIEKSRPAATEVVIAPDSDPVALQLGAVTRQKAPATDGQPWSFLKAGSSAFLEALVDRFPTMEEAGCKVGIGIATGCDEVYIGDYKTMPLENSVKVRLVTRGDLTGGTVRWGGKAVINTFTPVGGVVDIASYPKLAKYLDVHASKIKARHIAQHRPAQWFRTIDNLNRDLTKKPKILIPDIDARLTPYLDEEGLYPHHNLYYVLSDEWDMKALHSYLRSAPANLMASACSAPVRGGYFRYQAQYLRRIRLPKWGSLSRDIQSDLVSAFSGSQEDADKAACRALDLSYARVNEMLTKEYAV